MRIALVVALAAACGDNVAVPVAPDARVIACAASFTGDFDGTATVPACATATIASGHHVVSLAVPLAALHTSLAMSFDFGVASATGTYTSETIAAWSAFADQHSGTSGICVYTGGSDATPQGSFTMTLDAIDIAAGTAHGTVDAALAALAYPDIPCGPYDTERVNVTF